MNVAFQFALRSLPCIVLAACSESEPAPSINTNPAGEVVIEKGDTDAAIANARAVLAEFEAHQLDYADAGATVLEGLLNEDPKLIGVGLTQLANGLPKRIREQATQGDR